MKDELETVKGITMSRSEIDAFLSRQVHGTLSLARSNQSYAVPVSFGYEHDRLYLYLIRFGETSRKLEFSQQTEQACLITYEVEGRESWRSVIVRGALEERGEADRDQVQTIMQNSPWFGGIFPAAQPITQVHFWELSVDQATGRKGTAHQR